MRETEMLQEQPLQQQLRKTENTEGMAMDIFFEEDPVRAPKHQPAKIDENIEAKEPRASRRAYYDSLNAKAKPT